MLLPSVPSDQEEDDVDLEDPRAELVRRLLEYQKYKLAAEQIAARSILGRDVFVRGAPGPAVEGTPPLAPLGLFKLLESFQVVLDRAKKTLDHEIEFERISITDRINQLSDVLRHKHRVTFEELFASDTSRPELIITFLALLEMTRLRMTRLFQEAPLEPIFVELSVSDDDETGARLEPDAPVAPPRE
jgi:segregation and condensation protein A